jgi:hypothetical protein
MFGMSAHAVRAKTSIQVVLEVHLRRRGHESQTHIYTPAFAAPANVRICHFGVNVAIQHEQVVVIVVSEAPIQPVNHLKYFEHHSQAVQQVSHWSLLQQVPSPSNRLYKKSNIAISAPRRTSLCNETLSCHRIHCFARHHTAQLTRVKRGLGRAPSQHYILIQSPRNKRPEIPVASP